VGHCSNKAITVLATISSTMILTGCGLDEAPPELPLIEYKLVITDSIGVEIGEDEYMFAWPVNPTHSPSGDILFADRLKHTVFVFSPEGEFIRTIGREGITLYDSSYEYQGQLTWSGFDRPWLQTAVDTGGFVGITSTMMPNENGIEIVTTLGHWEGEGEPLVEYFSIESVFNPGNGIDHTESRESDIVFCATRAGQVFYSRSSIDEFEINGCEPDGTPFLHIEDENFHRVRKSEADLQAEMDFWNAFARMMRGDSAKDNTVKLDPYRRTILGMFTDGGERLWVRLGRYPEVVFRVYDFNGEILFHAMVEYDGSPADLNTWEITGDEHGFLAVNASFEYYQRVYMLTLVENE